MNGLENRIDPHIFNEDEIEIFAFIDGMKVYKNTKGQLCPIFVQLNHKNYVCSPFTVGLFYGDAKSSDVGSLVDVFVNEVKLVTNNIVKIHDKVYSFKLVALIADGQAQVYLKCIKGPIAFYGCESCIVQGITKERKRMYPNTDCEKRTKKSFTDKTQPEHHLENDMSPFLKIPGFDAIKDVVLDSMHWLFLGATKYILVKRVEKGNIARLKPENRKVFKKLMDSISEYVPNEFQRKIFDVGEISLWKATQYCFMLLYGGPIILKFVLDTAAYKHFLLLHLICRILCSDELAVLNVDLTDKLLKKIFILMPKFFGQACQVMNFHNLLHVADDVRHLQTPLCDYSSFWGENYIGSLKNLVQSTARPLPQIVNKLNAIKLLDNVKI